jgi:hypothetical protein
MKRWLIIMAVLALAGVAVVALMPAVSRAKVHSGPGIYGNLRIVQLAKEQWMADGHTNEWPTVKDLFPDASPGKTVQDVVRPRSGELYFINRTGAPPFAYIPKAGGQYKGGEILVLVSNGVAVVRQ